MNYINDEVKIDFPVPKDIAKLMKDCEAADAADDYGTYMNLADFLTDTLSKEAYVCGHITKKEWEAIERRYIQ